MALNKDQLTVKINVDSADANKQITSTVKNMESLDAAGESTSKSVNRLAYSEKELAGTQQEITVRVTDSTSAYDGLTSEMQENIKVANRDATALQAVSKRVGLLADSTEFLVNASQSFSIVLDSLSRNLQAVNSILEAGTLNMNSFGKAVSIAAPNAAASMDSFAKSMQGVASDRGLQKVADGFKQIEKSIPDANNLEQSQAPIMTITDKIMGLKEAWDLLVENITPERVKRIAHILSLLGFVANAKGFDRIAAGLEQASESAVIFGYEFQKIADGTDSIIAKIEMLRSIMRGLTIAAAGIGAAMLLTFYKAGGFDALLYAGRETIGVFKQIGNAIADVGKAFSKSGKEFSRVIRITKGDIDSLVTPQNFKALNQATNAWTKSYKEFVRDVIVDVEVIERRTSDIFETANKFKTTRMDTRETIKSARLLGEAIKFEFAKAQKEAMLALSKPRAETLFGRFTFDMDKTVFSDIAGLFKSIWKDSLRVASALHKSIVYGGILQSILTTGVAGGIATSALHLGSMLYNLDSFIQKIIRIHKTIGLWNYALKASQNLIQNLSNKFETLYNIGKKLGTIRIGYEKGRIAENFTEEIGNLYRKMGEVINKVFSRTAPMFAVAYQNMRAAGEGLSVNFFKGFYDAFTRSIGSFFSFISDLQIANAFKAALQPFKDLDFKPLANAFTQLGKTIRYTFLDVIRTIPMAFTDWNSLFKKIIITITTFEFTMIHMVEGLRVVSYAFAGLGFALRESDNAFVRWTGNLMIVTSVLSGGFLAAIDMVLVKIGGLVTALGKSLWNAMLKFEEKANKMQVTATNFAYTMQGFTEAFGSEAVGTLETWNKVVDDISDNTILFSSDVKKSATEIVQVGHALGLTVGQMETLLRMVPDYVKAGEDMFDVTVAFLQGLSGNSQSLIKYGIHMQDAVINQQKFMKESGILIDSLSEQEKAQVRYNLALEHHGPIAGRAAKQLQTVTGANQQLSNTLMEVQARLGQSNQLLITLRATFANMLSTILKIPQPILDVVGTIQEVGAVLLMVSGNVLAHSLAIAAMATSYATLKSVIADFPIVQKVLMYGFDAINNSLKLKGFGQAIVQITSLKDVARNTALVLKGTLAYSITQVGAALAKTAATWVKFASTIATSATTWKAAGIVAAIYVFSEAVASLEKTTKSFSRAWDSFVGSMTTSSGALGGVFTTLANTIGKAFTKIVQSVAMLLAHILSGMQGVVSVVSKMVSDILDGITWIFEGIAKISPHKDSMAKYVAEGVGTVRDGFRNVAKAAQEEAIKLQIAAGEYADKIFGGIAYAAEDGADKVKNALAKLPAAAQLVTDAERAMIEAQVSGNEALTLKLTKEYQKREMLMGKSVDERKNAAKELIRANAEIQKMFNDTMEESTKAAKEARLAELEAMISAEPEKIKGAFAKQAELIKQAAKIKIDMEIEPLIKKREQLMVLVDEPGTFAAVDAIDKQIESIKKKHNEESINLINKKAIDALNDFVGKSQEALDLLKNIGKTPLQLIGETFKKSMDDLDELQGKLGKLADKPEIKAQMDKMREAFTFQAQQKLETTPIYTDEQKQGLEDLSKQYYEFLDYRENKNKTQLQMLDEEYKKQMGILGPIEQAANDRLRELQVMDERLVSAKELQDAEAEVNRVLKLRQSLTTKNEEEKKQATGYTGELMKVFSDQTANLATTLTAGFSPVTAFMSAAQGIVGLFQQIVDFVPNILNAVGDLLRSASELPNTILNAVGSLLDGLVKTISDALPNLLKALPKILDSIITTLLETLPDAVVTLLEQLPSLATDFIKKLPEIAQKLIAGLITSSPKMIAAWIKFFVQGLPTIVWELIKMIVTVLPGALWDGITGAFKDIGKIFGNLFNGKSITDGLKKGATTVVNMVKDVAKSVTGVAEQIFSIQDITTARSAISDGMADIFSMETYKKAGKSIWDALVQAAKAAWDWIWSIGTAIWNGLWGAIKGAWKLVEGIGMAIWDGFIGMVKGALQAIMAIGGLIWDGLVAVAKAAWSFLSTIGAAIWDGLVAVAKAAWEWIKTIGGAIWEGLKAAAIGAWEFVKGLGGAIWEGFKEMLGGLGDILAAAGSRIWEGLSSIPTAIVNLFKWIGGTMWVGLGETISNAISSAKNGIIDLFKRLGTYIWEGLKSAVTSAPKSVWDSVTSVFKANGGVIPAYHALGGPINYLAPGGGPRGSDVVPAWLTPGEFIMSRGAVDKIGLQTLNRMNQGGEAGGQVINLEIGRIEINQAGDVDESFIKNKLLPTIERELRRKSLDGRYVLSAAGVR